MLCPLLRAIGTIPTPSEQCAPRGIFASPVAHRLDRAYTMREVHSKKEKKRGQSQKARKKLSPHHVSFSSFIQESQIASQVRAAGKNTWETGKHLGNPLQTFLQALISPHLAQETPLSLCSDTGASLAAIFIGANKQCSPLEGPGTVIKMLRPCSPAFLHQPLFIFLASLPDVLGHCLACPILLSELCQPLLCCLLTSPGCSLWLASRAVHSDELVVSSVGSSCPQVSPSSTSPFSPFLSSWAFYIKGVAVPRGKSYLPSGECLHEPGLCFQHVGKVAMRCTCGESRHGAWNIPSPVGHGGFLSAGRGDTTSFSETET